MENNRANRSPLIIGEVLFDQFPDDQQVLGGAPFNVAWNLHGMGFSPRMISAVGNDQAAERVRSAMSQWGMTQEFIQTVPDKPTGKVEVTLNHGEPEYDILKDRAWDFVQPPNVEDYQQFSWLYYGSLAYRSPRTAETIRQVIAESGLPRFVDINIRPPWFEREWLGVLVRDADWVKMNHDELEQMTDTKCQSTQDLEKAAGKFREEFGVRNFCITSGSKGAYLSTEDGDGIQIAVTTPDPLVDTVGAGDGFASVLLAGLIERRPLKEVGEAASRFAAKVCQMNGATCEDKSFYQDVFR